MSRRPSDRYPRLRRLFAAYVNQDWDAMGPRPEDAVRRSEAMLSHLVATSPDVITLTDLATGRYAMVNRSFESQTGYGAAEVVGRAAGAPSRAGRRRSARWATGRAAACSAVSVRRAGSSNSVSAATYSPSASSRRPR